MANSKVITRNDIQNILAHINLGDDAHREITQAEFNALSQAEKNNGTIYFITDGVSGSAFLEDNVPIGTITSYGGDSDPDYWLICDGRAISRTTYADLFAVIGTTYGTGDGSTTFNIPDLRGRITQGAGTLNNNTYILGEQKTAGLPNITGEYRHSWADGSGGGFVTPNGNAENNRGALGNKHSGTAYFGSVGSSSTDNYHANYLTFDASKANAIYGNSTTVQPNAVVTNYIIKAYSTVSEHQATVDFFYPVGSYYETSDNTFDPNTTWGGTWVLEAGDMMEQRKLLWTNPNPVSAFSAQTISINLSEYDAIDVGLRHYTDVDFMVWGRCYRTAQGVALTCSDKNLHRTTRTITMTDAGVHFTNAYGTNASGAFFNSGAESTNGSIPYRIYGIKQIMQYKWHRTV